MNISQQKLPKIKNIKEKNFFKIKEQLRDLYDQIRQFNIFVIGVPEGVEKKMGQKKIFE